MPDSYGELEAKRRFSRESGAEDLLNRVKDKRRRKKSGRGKLEQMVHEQIRTAVPGTRYE